MAVTVVITRDENGAPQTREVFAAADRYNVTEGNLTILIASQGGLATYMSGNWLSVYMDDSVEVITAKPAEDSSSDDFSFDSDSDSDSSMDFGTDSDTDSDSDTDTDTDTDDTDTDDTDSESSE